MIRWSIVEETADGGEWVSMWRESRDLYAVKQEIIGGYVSRRRVAMDYYTHTVIFGFDSTGAQLPVANS